MKVEITPETTEETTAMKEPFVRTGVMNACFVGRTADGKPAMFYSGSLLDLVADCTRAIEELRLKMHEASSFNAVINAHNAMVNAQKDAALIQKARNGRGLRMQEL